MIHRRFVLTSAAGEPIRGDLRHLASASPLPVVVVCHGFKGFKDWGFHPYLGERLAAAGFAAVHLGFSRNGVGADLLDFTEPESFGRNTLSTELSDLGVVLDAIPGAFPGAPLDPARVGLVGHSRGGGIAVVAAGERRVSALVTWAAVATFERWSDPAVLAAWRRDGRIEVKNLRTGQLLPMGVGFLDDLEANRERLDPVAAAARLACPYLAIHGTDDEAVPFTEGEALVAAARRGGAEANLLPLSGAGHTFGAAHPWAGTTPHLEAAVEATLARLDVLRHPR